LSANCSINGFAVLNSASNYSFFNGFLNKPIEPSIVKRLFGSYYRLNDGLKLVMAAFAQIAVGEVLIITPHNGSLNDTVANITRKSLHGNSLRNSFLLMAIILAAENQSMG